MHADNKSESERDLRFIRTLSDRLPPYLYRYTGISGERSGWVEDLLRTSSIFFPDYASLNDPFEGSVPLTFEGDQQEKRAYWETFLHERGQAGDPRARARVEWLAAGTEDPARDREIASLISGQVAAMGALSFSETETDIRLWSYYADGHRGLCLRFKTESLFMPEWDGCAPPLPVSYVNEYPSVPFYQSTMMERVVALTATKSLVWAHEREWRVVREAGRGLVPFNPSALDGVILGCKTPQGDRARIQGLVAGRSPETRLMQVRCDEKAYRLVVGEDA